MENSPVNPTETVLSAFEEVEGNSSESDRVQFEENALIICRGCDGIGLQEARKTLRWRTHNVFKYFQSHFCILEEIFPGGFQFSIPYDFLQEKNTLKFFIPVSKTDCTIQKSLSNGVK